MNARRLWLPLTVLVWGLGCRDAGAPAGPAGVAAKIASTSSTGERHVLEQAPSAPALETYQVAFWARVGTQTTVFLNYRPAPGQSQGNPFLRFKIPINGLVAGAGGVPLSRGDSVRIVMTVDSVRFAVDFQPSGVRYSSSSPAQLGIWYQDADPDLNGDGVVNAVDEALKEQLAIWNTDAWRQLSSRNNTTEQVVAAAIYHFSGYAVSW